MTDKVNEAKDPKKTTINKGLETSMNYLGNFATDTTKAAVDTDYYGELDDASTVIPPAPKRRSK